MICTEETDSRSVVLGGTGTPLTHRYISDDYYYDKSSNNDASSDSLERFSLIPQEKWRTDTVLPVALLPAAEGMSARSHHRIRQSSVGLDDAGMDLQAAQLRARTNQEISSTVSLSWLDWQLSLFIVFCATVGAILFTFLILLWLRKQMSREKDTEDGDMRGLVEEGAVCSSEKASKDNKDPIEAQWVHQSVLKPPVPVQPIRPVPETSGLAASRQIMAVATPERRPEPMRIRPKGLLERRGSSASLTIELTPAPESPPHVVTPTRECTAEEFLLSAGNILSRVQLKKAISDPSSLHKEFWEVPLNLPEKVDVCGSGIKNRYRSVLPNSQTRVVLPGSDDPLNSYINANYIRGYDGDNVRYIATQGPLINTIDDFWRMIWSERSPVVVMITRLHEAAKTKCDAYFPVEENSRINTGSYEIMVMSVVSRDGYTVRDLEIRHQSERRNILHYWYDSWPDHAVPQEADTLVSLAAEVNNLSGPIIVHCSAGIGRTGCFIALANGMTQLIRDGNVDVLGILCQMRYDRGGMIQTAEQYEFVHRALCLFEQTLDNKKSVSND
ncbi:tyrosine-protein phosphatase non-receptor type 5-like isoform X2 [Leptopilina heterotoma]|uniref:tyrosine-protein phosphatase non-receptor type 5-like isoform X2 n=1 Tax=Leptopilina heterotoma TaxID=63436 RepID=UPI001CA7DB57|nr:tyrosine-protein phosphatase non-receptor type 5-like isoform X2 [Leptopilina heterotoma]